MESPKVQKVAIGSHWPSKMFFAKFDPIESTSKHLMVSLVGMVPSSELPVNHDFSASAFSKPCRIIFGSEMATFLSIFKVRVKVGSSWTRKFRKKS